MVVHFRVILHRNLTPCSLLIVRYLLPTQCPLIAHLFPNAIDLHVPSMMVTDGLWNGAAFHGHSAQESHPLLIAHCWPFTTSLSSNHHPLLKHRGVPPWQNNNMNTITTSMMKMHARMIWNISAAWRHNHSWMVFNHRIELWMQLTEGLMHIQLLRKLIKRTKEPCE